MSDVFDYGEMQDLGSELLAMFKQGTVELKRIVQGTAPNEWTPAEDTVQTWPLDATVRRLHQRYEGGVLIIDTGDLVTFAVPPVEPLVTDHLIIDGVERVITNLTPAVGAGQHKVVWKAWCKA